MESITYFRCVHPINYPTCHIRRSWIRTRRSRPCLRPRPQFAQLRLPWRRSIITSNSNRRHGSSPHPFTTICSRNCTISPPCTRTPWPISRTITMSWTRPRHPHDHRRPGPTKHRTLIENRPSTRKVFYNAYYIIDILIISNNRILLK